MYSGKQSNVRLQLNRQVLDDHYYGGAHARRRSKRCCALAEQWVTDATLSTAAHERRTRASAGALAQVH